MDLFFEIALVITLINQIGKTGDLLYSTCHKLDNLSILILSEFLILKFNNILLALLISLIRLTILYKNPIDLNAHFESSSTFQMIVSKDIHAMK